jgi:hypothetical protein
MPRWGVVQRELMPKRQQIPRRDSHFVLPMPSAGQAVALNKPLHHFGGRGVHSIAQIATLLIWQPNGTTR